MKRHSKEATKYLSVLLALSAGIVVAGDQAAGQPQGQVPPAYTYSDDWAVVSAPPPQGPYNAFNLDPRIPGQDLVAPMPMPDTDSPEMPGVASTGEGTARASGSAGDISATSGRTGQASVPPQTPYDYQPQSTRQDRSVQAHVAPEQRRTPMRPFAPDSVPRQDSYSFGPDGLLNAPYPAAGGPARRPQPPVASVQQPGHENRPPPGYYRPRDYSQPATRPMYGYPWSSRHSYSGYPGTDAGHSRSPWQGEGPRASEVEVPPPAVYDRMMAEPPSPRYAPPPGRVDYYGGGR